MPRKYTDEELEAIARESHKRVMLKRRERELREYLKKLSPAKKARTVEHKELKKIVDSRHKDPNKSLCSKCNHNCHMFTEHGWCHNDACACRHCDCPRCDLEYNH